MGVLLPFLYVFVFLDLLQCLGILYITRNKDKRRGEGKNLSEELALGLITNSYSLLITRHFIRAVPLFRACQSL